MRTGVPTDIPIPSVPGFHIRERISHGKSVQVLRAIRLADSRSFVIKAAVRTDAHSEIRNRLIDEYSLGSLFAHRNIIRYYEIIHLPEGVALVLEDFPGLPLNQRSGGRPYHIADFIETALIISETVRHIHSQGIIHKNLGPLSILQSSDLTKLKIIDFSRATIHSQETRSRIPATGRMPRLAYISPEQTGRMNRMVDYRTDFYTLGITFYQMLCGRTPFVGDNPMEVIHQHLAANPPPLAKLNDEVPQTVADIVGRLIAKNPDDRYQTMGGLIHDLQTCLEFVRAGKKIPAFGVGTADGSGVFRLPQKLFGRRNELRTLLEGMSRSRQSTCQFLFISGYSGSGKSSLAWEAVGRLTKHAGAWSYFVNGKFDRLEYSSPYSGWLDASRDFIHQLASDDENQVAYWRERLQMGVNAAGPEIFSLLPELSGLIEEKINGRSRQSKRSAHFGRMLISFFANCAAPEHPLIIFLDDLQWADEASMELLTLLAENPVPHLLVVGTFRPDEAARNDSLRAALDAISVRSEQSARVEPSPPVRIDYRMIDLRPLDRASIMRLLSQTLKHKPGPELAGLAEVIDLKTGGNPFLVKQILSALHSQGLIFHDRTSGRWLWNFEKIKDMQIPPDIVDFLIDRLGRLSPDTRNLLESAACIGTTFDLPVLAELFHRPEIELGPMLHTAINEGFILPLSEIELDDPEDLKSSLLIFPRYRFLHDRLHNAIYDCLDSFGRKQLHLRIGRILLRTFGADDNTSVERLFDIINHLNKGREYIIDEGELNELLDLNLESCRLAKRTNAYGRAWKDAQVALELATSIPDVDKQKVLVAYKTGVEVCHLRRDTKNLDRLLEQAKPYAASDLEFAPLAVFRMKTLLGDNRIDEAIDIAGQLLLSLGEKLPKKPSIFINLLRVYDIRLRLGKKMLNAIDQGKALQDARLRLIVEILLSLLATTYLRMPDLLPAMLYRVFAITARGGASPFAPESVAYYSSFLISAFDDIERSYDAGRKALALADELDERGSYPGRTLQQYAMNVRYWKEPIGKSLDSLSRSMEISMNSADTEYYGRAAGMHAMYSLLSGENVGELATILRSRLNQKQIRMNPMVYPHMNTYLEVADFLAGIVRPVSGGFLSRSESANSPTGDLEAELRSILRVIFSVYLASIDVSDELEMARQGLKHFSTVYIRPVFLFSETMVLIDRVEEVGLRRGPMGRIKQNCRKLRKYNRIGPANFSGKLRLLEGRLACIRGNFEEALTGFDDAMSHSLDAGLPHEAGLAALTAARYVTRLGRDYLAEVYVRAAFENFSVWGAQSVLRELTREFPLLNVRSRSWAGEMASGKNAPTPAKVQSNLIGLPLSIREISAEMDMEKLLSRLMEIVLSTAGAARGYLLLVRNWSDPRAAPRPVAEQELFVYAGREAGKFTEVYSGYEAEKHPHIPIPVVHYTMRTGEVIRLDDLAQHTTSFGFAPGSAGSALCVPIRTTNRIIGALYTENPVPYAFHDNHTSTLEVLLAQAAVSLNNSVLYSRTQTLNKELAREVKERASIEAALRTSEAAVFHIYDNSPIMMHSIDEDNRICKVNRRWLEETGYGYEEVIGRKADFLMTPQSREYAAREVLPRFWKEGLARGIRYQYIRKDGSIMNVVLDCDVTVDPNGERISLSVVRPIDDRLELEAELIRQKALVRSVYEAAGDIIISLDKGGFLVAAQTPSDKSLLLRPESEMVGRHYKDILPKYLSALVDGALSRIEGGEKRVIVPYALRVPGGERHFEAAISRRFSDNGDFCGTTIIVRVLPDGVKEP